MVKVIVKNLGITSRERGGEVEVGDATIRGVIDALEVNVKRLIINPETGQLQYGLVISLNGKDIRSLEGMNTVVKDGDEIILHLLVAGG